MVQAGQARGVIAAGHPLTAAAGAEMLRQGGNAFDAAIAAVMTAWVTEPVLTSAGGAGFLLAHTAAGEDCLFDFFAHTPRERSPQQPVDFYPIEADFGDTVQEFHIGLGSMAVPGCIAGLLHIHQRLGRLPLAAIAQPAIHHARTGIQVSPFLGYCFDLLAPILTATAAAREIYAPQEKLLTAGDTLRMPRLATFLETLVQQGAAAFYGGAIAEQIVQDCQTQGGYLTAGDLSAYQVIARSPLAIPYQGHTLLTNPPPSSGGALIAFALELLKTANPAQFVHGSAAHGAALITAMALTNTARRNGYDRRLHEPDIAQAFLAPSHCQPYAQTLMSTVNPWVNKLGSTTHISVLDAEGNAASVTTSNGEGASYVIPGTDIMMNNMLGEEDLHPHGFHQWPPNQRISSMMAPTLVLKEGKPRLVLGSGGSNRIRTAILQVISNVLDFSMPLAEAVATPRLHWERDVLHVEPGYPELPPAIAAAPIESILRWEQQNMFFGGVHAVAMDDQQGFQGAGDARRGGTAIVID